MKAILLAAGLLGLCLASVNAHGVGTAPVTWNREISRLVYDRCATCHRPEGSAFSLMTYSDAQPRANEIKEAVLSRRMPPWGAVKGFGSFRNDQSLTQEQIELVVRWVDGGIRRGNNPRLLPKTPTFKAQAAMLPPAGTLKVSGSFTTRSALTLDGLLPERVPEQQSMRVVAVRPGGAVEPLVWLHDYDRVHPHAFLFRTSVYLPAGTRIEGVPSDAVIALLPLGKP